MVAVVMSKVMRKQAAEVVNADVDAQFPVPVECYMYVSSLLLVLTVYNMPQLKQICDASFLEEYPRSRRCSD